MTVAAIVVPMSRDEALADAGGRAAARRIVDAAWAGGAIPIVVVGDGSEGSLAAVLAGSPAVLVSSGPGTALDARPGPGASDALRAGLRAALDAVAETDAVLCWPGAMTWVDPETVTSLIEAHGGRPDRLLRPALEGVPGWPLLVPVEAIDDLLDGAEAERGGSLPGLDDLLGAAERRPIDLIELGDPGTIHPRTLPLDELPAYAGPPGPMGGAPPEWGAAAADEPD